MSGQGVRRAAYLGLGMPTALAGLLAAGLALLAAAVAMVPAIGWLVWLLAATSLGRLGAWEAWRARHLVDHSIEVPVLRVERGRGIDTDSVVWRQVGYWLVRPALAAFQVAGLSVVVGLPVVAVVALGYGWWRGWSPPWLNGDWSPQVTRPVLGLVAILVATKGVGPLTRGLVALDLHAAHALLGSREQELVEQVGELRSRRARAVDAAEQERRRIERDLHDGAQQRLVALGMLLGRAEARLGDREPAVRELLAAAKAEARSAVAELRNLTRGLVPPVLTDRGLDAALSALAGRSAIPVAIQVELDPRPSATIESVLYFAVSEALTNATKHARARRVSISVCRVPGSVAAEPDRISALIVDDGVGGARLEPGGGLAGLADRLAGVDGALRVDSPAGGPTVLTIEIPDGSARRPDPDMDTSTVPLARPAARAQKGATRA